MVSITEVAIVMKYIFGGIVIKPGMEPIGASARSKKKDCAPFPAVTQ